MASIVISATSAALPVGEQFEHLARHLVDAGHDVALVTFRPGATGADHIAATEPGLRRLRWPSVEPTRLDDARFLRRLIRDFRPQCIVGQMSSVNWTMTVGRAMRVPARLAWYHFVARAGMIDAGETTFPLRARRRMISYHCATRVVSVSQAACEEMREFYRVSPDRCVVVHNGLDEPAAPERSHNGDGRHLVTVGRLVRSKGHDVLIASLASIGTATQLEIVGDGPDRAQLEALATKAGLGDNVRFHGDLAHDDAMAVMRSADVYIHPSRMDNLPGAVLEAMSFGLPIVATRVGGVPEIITGGVDGLLVPSENASALASAIGSLVGDADLRAKLGSAAKRRFDDHFTTAAFCARARAVIEDEIARS